MLFKNRPPGVDIHLCKSNELITRVRVTEFLGVLIDKDLNWRHHINTVRTKLSKFVAIIYNASCLINHDRMYILYCYLFLPYISYCSEIWGNTYVTNIRCITVIQKRVIRLVC